MSIVSSRSVFCDGISVVDRFFDREDLACESWIGDVTDGQGGVKEARRQARAAGWKRRNAQTINGPRRMVDLCPSCDRAEKERRR